MKMDVQVDDTLDCKGLSCPMPIVKLAKKMKKEMSSGQVLLMEGTDPGSKTDVPKWCDRNGHAFLGMEEESGVHKYWIRKA
jgi:tRNA 2-thiouridine synthesizing protein A